jgi:hypothetical protein
LAGFRRLRFSFFADEHAPGALRLCKYIQRALHRAWPIAASSTPILTLRTSIEGR